MVGCKGKEPDLERGDRINSMSTTEVALSPVSTSTSTTLPVGYTEEDINAATGQTGSARRKQHCRDWMFFSACERQTAMCLDYLQDNLWATYKEIECLERQNRDDERDDYQKHRPENEYGDKKAKLMDKLMADTERYFSIFSNASTVMNQSAPHPRKVHDFRLWTYSGQSIVPNVSLDAAHGAENYRILGPRPSVIDTLMQTTFQAAMECFYQYFDKPAVSPTAADANTDTTPTVSKATGKNSDSTPNIIQFNWSYTKISIIAHIIMITFALTFLLLPLTLVYILDLSKGCAVIVVGLFCLLFCLIFFIFGRLNTDHKFILLLAYTGVMATLLSNMGTVGVRGIVEGAARAGVPAGD